MLKLPCTRKLLLPAWRHQRLTQKPFKLMYVQIVKPSQNVCSNRQFAFLDFEDMLEQYSAKHWGHFSILFWRYIEHFMRFTDENIFLWQMLFARRPCVHKAYFLWQFFRWQIVFSYVFGQQVFFATYCYQPCKHWTATLINRWPPLQCEGDISNL